MTLQIQFYRSASPTQTSPWPWTDNVSDTSKHGWCSLKVVCSEQQFWGPEWEVMWEGQGGSVNKCFISSWEGIYVGEYWWPVKQSGIIKKATSYVCDSSHRLGWLRWKSHPNDGWNHLHDLGSCKEEEVWWPPSVRSLPPVWMWCDLLPPCLPYHDDDGLCALEL